MPFERVVGTDDARWEAALQRRRESLQTIKRTGRWDAPEVEEALRQIPSGRRKWFEEHFAEATRLASYADPNRRLDPAFLDELARQTRRTLAMEG